VFIWYIFPVFGITDQEKSGNPGANGTDAQVQLEKNRWPYRIVFMSPSFRLSSTRVARFYAHLVYFVAIWNILWLSGTFFQFWYVVPRKIWQPCHQLLIFTEFDY
jgi:hypothetical protein